MTEFLKRLDELFNAPYTKDIKTSIRWYEQESAKEKLLAEQHKQPQAGIYYWVPYSNGQWKIYSFWEEFYGPKTIHAVIWKEHLARELAELYNKLPYIQQIQEYPYGLSRGRIFKKDNHCQLWHGGDSPVPDWKEIIFNEFNLSSENTEIIEHPHEKPKQSHIEALRKIGVMP